MKKAIYGVLTCLLIAALSLTFSGSLKHKKKHKKRSPVSEVVAMQLPANPPYEMIQGIYREKMIDLIHHFPSSGYQLFSVPGNGLFYLDTFDDFIKGHLSRGGTWEIHIQKLIRQYTRPGSTVLDIGAHIGTHTLTMAQAVGSQGKVLAFEPQPKSFRELFLNMAINKLSNIAFYWAGVGDHVGEVELSPLDAGNEGGSGI